MGVYLNSKPQDAISNECRNCHDPFWSPKNEKKPLGGQGFMGGALQILVVPIPRKAHFGRPKNRLSTVDPDSIFMDWVERLPLTTIDLMPRLSQLPISVNCQMPRDFMARVFLLLSPGSCPWKEKGASWRATTPHSRPTNCSLGMFYMFDWYWVNGRYQNLHTNKTLPTSNHPKTL